MDKERIIKVQLFRIETDKCRELWMAEPDPKGVINYYLRDEYGKSWYEVADAPYGSCECSFNCPKNILFIICDRQWNELHRESNDFEKYPQRYPTLDEVCNDQWKDLSGGFEGLNSYGLEEWLLAKAPDGLHSNARYDWVRTDHSILLSEDLHAFRYLDYDYKIVRNLMQHDKCDYRWWAYHAVLVEEDGQEYRKYFYTYQYGDDLSKELSEIPSPEMDTNSMSYNSKEAKKEVLEMLKNDDQSMLIETVNKTATDQELLNSLSSIHVCSTCGSSRILPERCLQCNSPSQVSMAHYLGLI